jgi:hypothetical protein
VRRHWSNVPENFPDCDTGRLGSLLEGSHPDREQMRIMIFGHNTNLKIGNVTFHIQTEDRGESHALIDTTVYYLGRVVHRRANNYFDLLPLDQDRQQALKLRLDEQHRAMIEEMRSGTLQLAVPPTPASASPSVDTQAAQVAPEPRSLLLELINAKSWLSGKHVKLHVRVRQPSGELVSGAELKVQVEGSENGTPFEGLTDAQGQAQIEFELPRITAAEAALVIHAQDPTGKGHLRFALRMKPRVA